MNSREKDKQKKRVVSAKRYVTEHKTGFSRESIDIPEGAPMWSPKEKGIYRIDVIPYVVGKGNRFADEGELYYERTYWTHKGMGDSKDSYTCLQMTFNKPCPICEYRTKLANDPDSDPKLVKMLKPKERQLWNIIDLSDRDKGPQIWEVSHHLFGKHLIEKIKADDENEGYDTFADLEKGKTLKITATEEHGDGAMKWISFAGIDFKPRAKTYDDDMSEKAYCLDKMPKNVPYEQLRKKFFQEPEDQGDLDEDDNPPTKSKSEDDDDKPVKKKVEDPTAEDMGIEEESTVNHKEYGTCEVVHVSGDGTSLRLLDEDGNKHSAVNPIDCKLVEKDDDDEPKKKTNKDNTKNKSEKDDDEKEEDDSKESVEYEIGSTVIHEDYGQCDIVKDLGAGKWTLEEEDGSVHKGVHQKDFKLATKKKKVVDEDEDQDDEPKSKDDDEFEDD